MYENLFGLAHMDSIGKVPDMLILNFCNLIHHIIILHVYIYIYVYYYVINVSEFSGFIISNKPRGYNSLLIPTTLLDLRKMPRLNSFFVILPAAYIALVDQNIKRGATRQ